MSEPVPFVFQTERRIVRLTGRRASTLRHLPAGLRLVSGASIFYHTYHRYLSQHFVPAPGRNDFAAWTTDALQEPELGERLAAVDLLEFTTIRALRTVVLDAVEQAVEKQEGWPRACPAGNEFHFCESQSFVMNTGLVARDPEELFRLVRDVSNVSLFYHLFEARLRLGRPTNDFSEWLRHRGADAEADAIERIDPYPLTLDACRERIAAIGSRR
jgi:hypothetical protein